LHTLDDIINLNCLNIGAGGRTINPYLISIDLNRGQIENNTVSNGITQNSILSSASELPFKDDSIDCIVALHILEHIENPVDALREWLRVLKPGAKMGIVLPNWKYAWDASNDHSKYGHRWNSSPEITKKMLVENFSDCELIYFDTYDYKLSFDFVIKKPGIYTKTIYNFGRTGHDIGNGIGKCYYKCD